MNSTAHSDARQFFSSNQRVVLWVLWLTYGSFYFCRNNLSVALPGLQAELGYTKSQLGTVLMALKLAYGAGQFINGQLAEHWPPRKLLALGLLASAALNVVFGWATALYFLTFIWACNGYVQALGWPPTMRVAANWFPALQRGRAIGIVGTGYQLCGALTFIVAGWAAEKLGWRGALYVPAVIVVASAVHMLVFLKDRPEVTLTVEEMARAAPGPARSLGENLAVTLTNPALWLVAIALCLPLFDNHFYGQPLATTSTRWPGGLLIATAVIMLGLSMIRLLRLFRVDHSLVRVINHWLDSVPIVNHYGLFSVMTTSRMEIVVEGSRDGRTWEPYEFKWKPCDVTRAPPWVAPHQPRLDWQMWFAALGDYRLNGWFIGFLIRLLQGSPPVLALLRHNPFPDGPPSYVRAVLYQYRFTDRKTRRETGAWWTREKRWLYCPVYSLRGPEREFMRGDDF